MLLAAVCQIPAPPPTCLGLVLLAPPLCFSHYVLTPPCCCPQVLLTADYQPSKLMDLLVASQYYPLEVRHVRHRTAVNRHQAGCVALCGAWLPFQQWRMFARS